MQQTIIWLKRSLLCLVFLSAGCTQIKLAAVNLPSHFDDVTIIHDVAYGAEPWQKLDIYMPPLAASKTLDTLVFFHGGRWTFGSKDDYKFIGSSFANQGFVVVIPDYSKYPQARFPAFVEDGARALAWTYDNIVRYHGDPALIHLAGHSAGAHIAALLTADPHYLRDLGKDRSVVIHDFAGLAGPYDFTPDEPDLIDMFGPPSRYPSMQVTTFIDGAEPPMLLLYGDNDQDVKLSNLEKLRRRISEKGGCEQSIIYPGVDHVGLVAALSWLNPQNVPVLQDMVNFFHTAHDLCAAAGSHNRS